MKTLLKIGLPVCLGLLAAGLNWITVKAKTPTSALYVKVKKDFTAGQAFTAADLDMLEIPDGDEGTLKETAIPHRHAATLYGRPCQRDMKKNDIVFWRDAFPPPPTSEEERLPVSLEGMSVVNPQLLVVGNEITFVVASAPTPPGTPPAPGKSFQFIGPFRITSVGAATTREDQEGDKGRGDRSLTVAIKRGDDLTTKLLTAIKAKKEGQQQFVEIVLEGSKKP